MVSNRWTRGHWHTESPLLIPVLVGNILNNCYKTFIVISNGVVVHRSHVCCIILHVSTIVPKKKIDLLICQWDTSVFFVIPVRNMLGRTRNNVGTVATVLVGTPLTRHSLTPRDHMPQSQPINGNVSCPTYRPFLIARLLQNYRCNRSFWVCVIVFSVWVSTNKNITS